MTEPAVASSDATNIQASIEKDGNDYVLNGRKWWTTGAMHPKAELCIFMGKTDPNAAKHRVRFIYFSRNDMFKLYFMC